MLAVPEMAYEKVKSALIGEISSGRIAPGTYLPSERLICERFGVSRDTVRRAIKDLKSSGCVMAGKGCRPVASGLFAKRRGVNASTIAFVSDIPFSSVIDDRNNHLSNVFLHILKRLEERNFSFAYHMPSRTGRSGDWERMTICQGYAAVVYYPGGGRHEKAVIDALVESGSPCVCVEAYLENDSTDLDTVDLDNRHGAYIATRHMLERGLKDIVHFTFQETYKWIVDRVDGFRDAMHEAGIDPEPRIIRPATCREWNRDATIFLQAAKTLPEGVFCATDQLAWTLSRKLASDGKRIPDDVSIVGFDNIEAAWTTVSHSTREIGEATAEILLARLDPVSPRTGEIRKTMIKPKLIVRDSVKDNRLTVAH